MDLLFGKPAGFPDTKAARRHGPNLWIYLEGQGDLVVSRWVNTGGKWSYYMGYRGCFPASRVPLTHLSSSSAVAFTLD